MVCPKCGQEIIDTKEFCVNCGTRLVETKKVSKKTVLIIFIAMIILGVLTCYIVMNYNTSSELEPYLNNSEVD